jgi:hypothetical protein
MDFVMAWVKVYMQRCLTMALLAAAAPALADEGMWTLDHFPADAVRQTYGFEITPAWLDHLRLSTIRLSNCTASFVSPDGLMLTNHHCAEACLADLSTREKSLERLGFAAPERRGELRCSRQVADVLLATEDITDRVAAATAGLADDAANDARNRALTALEQTCEGAGGVPHAGRLKCESVSLYQGGQYFLYKYRHYDDVRLVFSPEGDMANFGGDPDNFQFPRWRLDFTLLRAYENGRPARTPDFLSIDFRGPADHELVFVSGHPGATLRHTTRAQLEFERDVRIPNWLLRASELRGRYIQYGRTGADADRVVAAPLHGLENGIKYNRKLLDALHDDVMLERKSREEAQLRAALGGDFDPWADIRAATERERAMFLPYLFLERGAGFNGTLFRYARMLVRGAAERAKPNGDRLREFVDVAVPGLQQELFAPVPVDPGLEILNLSFSLQKMREWLGTDDPVVREVLGRDSPDVLAGSLISQSRLADPVVRRKLWDGGKAAIDASADPMIKLAQQVDAPSRAVRKDFEDHVEAPTKTASEKIAAGRFRVQGTNAYPDATFTLRLNFGTVQGWVESGAPVPPFTHLGRAFERETGVVPLRIPDDWMKMRDRLDPLTPFDLTTNNDIVGGNSGSPLVDAKGRIVGLVFDGNIHSISGAYWFDADRNRAVAVHPAIIQLALGQVYAAKALLRELEGKPEKPTHVH